MTYFKVAREPLPEDREKLSPGGCADCLLVDGVRRNGVGLEAIVEGGIDEALQWWGFGVDDEGELLEGAVCGGWYISEKAAERPSTPSNMIIIYK